MRINIILVSVCLLSLFSSFNVIASPNHHKHEGSRDHHKSLKSNTSSQAANCKELGRIEKNKQETDKLIQQLVIADNRETRRALMNEYHEISKCY